MISSDDERWLAESYPGLVRQENVIAGKISFTASYNEKSNQFLIMRDREVDAMGGTILSCEYQIRVVTRDEITYSALPALYVDEIDVVNDRHFAFDRSACLCSPLQEKEFLFPKFDFPKFLEQLVVPFLYGQSFYSRYNHWPWAEYTHGVTGLLESLVDEEILDADTIRNFLSMLAIEKGAWPDIRVALQRARIKGHTLCFCPKHDQIRRCHPKALIGIRKLEQEIKGYALPLPGTA